MSESKIYVFSFDAYYTCTHRHAQIHKASANVLSMHVFIAVKTLDLAKHLPAVRVEDWTSNPEALSASKPRCHKRMDKEKCRTVRWREAETSSSTVPRHENDGVRGATPFKNTQLIRRHNCVLWSIDFFLLLFTSICQSPPVSGGSQVKLFYIDSPLNSWTRLLLCG